MVGASRGRVAGRDACVPSLLVITPPAEPASTRPQRREGQEQYPEILCRRLFITPPAEPAGTRPQRREQGTDAKLVIRHESWVL